MSVTRPLRLRNFLIATLLAVATCITAAVALPHDPYIRYQSMAGTIFDRTRWIYERIHFDDAPIDIAFIGSSRTARGVISPAIEDGLKRAGLDKRVVNFSLPASGFDIRLTLARELLEARDVELLVISLVEQFPRDGHQAFRDLATAADILNSPWIVNRNLPENVARLPIRQIQLATKTWLPGAFGYQADFDPAAYAGTSIDPRLFNATTNRAAESAAEIAALDKESNFRRRSLTPPILPEPLQWVEFGIPRSYIRRIAALADEHGTKLVFLYLPFYKGFPQPAEREWLEQFGPVLSAEFLLSSPQNYNDVAHASAHGADLLTDWLTQQLTPLLTPAANEASSLPAASKAPL